MLLLVCLESHDCLCFCSLDAKRCSLVLLSQRLVVLHPLFYLSTLLF